jgi:hypothetical protein
MKNPEAVHAEQLAHDDLQGRGELIVMLEWESSMSWA